MVNEEKTIMGNVFSIFIVWLPLAISQILMNFELPIVNANIARGQLVAESLAALSVATSMVILMESGVMMILPVSVSLFSGYKSLVFLRKFTVFIGFLMSLAVFTLSIDGVFEFVTKRFMHLPVNLMSLTQNSLRILIPWPIAIAWRRMHQGILIKIGKTNLIVMPTILRVTLSGAISYIGIVHYSGAPIIIASIALIAGVIAESLLVFLIANYSLKFAHIKDTNFKSLSFSSIVSYYLPLALTSFLTFLLFPIINSGLSRSYNPLVSLAIWPVVFGLIHTLNALSYPIQEVVLVLNKTGLNKFSAKFAIGVGIFASVMAFSITFEPVANIYFRLFGGMPAEYLDYCQKTLALLVPIPLLVSIQSFFRGNLVATQNNNVIQTGMIINVTFLVLALSVFTTFFDQTSGLIIAPISILMGAVFECLYLFKKYNLFSSPLHTNTN